MEKAKMKKLIDRFEGKINKTNECWIWIGAKGSCGYGSINVSGKTLIASRVSYEIYVGRIPESMCVLHKCDNPSCVNPEHLFIGTQSENIKDMIEKKRDKGITTDNRLKTHCKNGHELKADNIYYYHSNGTEHRGCRSCVLSRSKIVQELKRCGKPKRQDRTHCQRGHELIPANLSCHDGRKRCLACLRLKERERYWKAKQLDCCVSKNGVK